MILKIGIQHMGLKLYKAFFKKKILKIAALSKASLHNLQHLNQFFIISGCMLCLGRSNYFRFNHPREARKMREAMPKNYRVSCEPLRLFQGKLKPK